MKKLIVLSVIFALVVGSVFAVDIGSTVIGDVTVIQSDTSDATDGTITTGAGMSRIRIDGSGEVADGAFGGYFRVEHAHWSGEWFFGNAWWKPIDQFKLIVGSNGGDGFYGKEGNTGWMFYQTITDTGVAMGGNSAWGGGAGGYNTRYAFFGGDNGFDAVRLEINPLDVLGINVNLPFFDGGEIGDVFKSIIAQVNVNLDFGTIALTYAGGGGGKRNKPGTGTTSGGKWFNYDTATVVTTQPGAGVNFIKIEDPVTTGVEQEDYTNPSKIYLYFGGNFGDLALDVGFSAKFGGDDDYTFPIGVGLGAKYATDSFGVKFRVAAALGGDDKGTYILADVLPYFPLGDKLTVFISAGLTMVMPDEGDSVTGWHFNPYIQVGEEWGAKFLAGIKVSSNGEKVGDDDATINWSVPIAIVVSF